MAMKFTFKKLRPLRELGIISIIYTIFLIYLWGTSVNKKAILGVFIFFFVVYILPIIILYNNYLKIYNSNKGIDLKSVSSKNIERVQFVGTYQKIKNSQNAFTLPYCMNFFYVKIDLKDSIAPILITSLEEYDIEKRINQYFPNIKIEKQIDVFPLLPNNR